MGDALASWILVITVGPIGTASRPHWPGRGKKEEPSLPCSFWSLTDCCGYSPAHPPMTTYRSDPYYGPFLDRSDRPSPHLAVIALAARVTAAAYVDAQYNNDHDRLGHCGGLHDDQCSDQYDDHHDSQSDDQSDDDDNIWHDPYGSDGDLNTKHVNLDALMRHPRSADCGFDDRTLKEPGVAEYDEDSANDHGCTGASHDDQRDHRRPTDDDSKHTEPLVISPLSDQGVHVSNPNMAVGDCAMDDNNQYDNRDDLSENEDEEDDGRDNDNLSRDQILSRCPPGAHRHASAWQPVIDACLDALASREPAQTVSDDINNGGADLYEQGAAAVLCRFLPALAAYQFDIYDVVVHLENADHIGHTWNDDDWLAEAYCGMADWLIHVACRRTRVDDARIGPEHGGGTIRITRLVHRHRRKSVTYISAPLGDGYDRHTHQVITFIKSGSTSYDAFVDACYGPLKRVGRVLAERFQWTLKDGLDDVDDDDIWDDNTFAYAQSNSFVRASDGTVVSLAWQEGSLFVCNRDEPSDVAPAAYATLPDDENQRLTVPRPPSDYDSLIRDGDMARERKHADRAHLVQHGLLDPTHVAPLGCPTRWPRVLAKKSSWPCVHFPYDPYVPMNAETEADWHRRLAKCMDIVADLLRRGPMGDLVISSDAMRAAVRQASPRMAIVAGPAIGKLLQLDARALNSMVKTMLSPVLSTSWRINAPDEHVRFGSRYVDAARGLYINWNMRCNFVSCAEAAGLVHPRFYGHILVLDERKHTSADGRAAASLSVDDQPEILSEDCGARPLTVVAYYAVSLRVPKTQNDAGYYDMYHTQRLWRDMDGNEREAVDAAIAAIGPALQSRFGRDEPHHVIDHYRQREFGPVPRGRFRGIVQEDALGVGPAASPAVAIIRAFDWLRAAFERHAAAFGVAR
nr:hypothetical protein [Pandoravirus massiliensis]